MVGEAVFECRSISSYLPVAMWIALVRSLSIVGRMGVGSAGVERERENM